MTMGFLPTVSVAQFNTKGMIIMDDTLSSLVRLRALRERVEVQMNLTAKGTIRNKFVRCIALLDQRVAIMAGVLNGTDNPAN
jgi:hypothetical protein